MKQLLVGVLMLGLVGCSAQQQLNQQAVQQADSFAGFIDAVKVVTLKDIETATADVHANGDVDLAALQCYPALAEFIKSNSGLQKPTVDGLISANQLKRDVILGLRSNGAMQVALRKLHVACAAYVSDERRFAAEFMIAIGAASHGVPALPVLQ